MKEAIVSKGPRVEIIDSPIPTAGPDQIVTRVIISGCNPKDWKRAEMSPKAINQGDDIAGVVHEVGENVTEFRPGDRVAAFHQMMAPHGSWAEYAVSWSHTTFHLPKTTSFEEAATLPLAAMTSACGLYQRLSLPLPWKPALSPIPLIIYGAASAVGSYAIQLAQQSNIHPLICIAGRGIPHVESLISRDKGDIIIDYRDGDEAVVRALKAAAETHGGLHYAFDAVAEKGSYVNISQVLDQKHGKITLVLPGKKYEEIPASIEKSTTTVGCVFEDLDSDKWEKRTGKSTGNPDFGYAMYRLFTRGLQQGWLKGHPHEVVPGGLGGVQSALEKMKNGEISAKKQVFRIADTKGVAESANL